MSSQPSHSGFKRAQQNKLSTQRSRLLNIRDPSVFDTKDSSIIRHGIIIAEGV